MLTEAMLPFGPNKGVSVVVNNIANRCKKPHLLHCIHGRELRTDLAKHILPTLLSRLLFQDGRQLDIFSRIGLKSALVVLPRGNGNLGYFPRVTGPPNAKSGGKNLLLAVGNTLGVDYS